MSLRRERSTDTRRRLESFHRFEELAGESERKRVCILELTSLELGPACVDLALELVSVLRDQLVVLGEQHLHNSAFGQLDRFIRHDDPFLDVRSDRLHVGEDSIAP